MRWGFVKLPDPPLTPKQLQDIRDRQDRKQGQHVYHNALLAQQDRKNLLAYVAWQAEVIQAGKDELVRVRRSLSDV